MLFFCCSREIDDEHFDSLAKETLRHIKLDDSDVAEVSVSIELRKASNVLGQLQGNDVM